MPLDDMIEPLITKGDLNVAIIYEVIRVHRLSLVYA